MATLDALANCSFILKAGPETTSPTARVFTPESVGSGSVRCCDEAGVIHSK